MSDFTQSRFVLESSRVYTGLDIVSLSLRDVESEEMRVCTRRKKETVRRLPFPQNVPYMLDRIEDANLTKSQQ